MACLYWSRNSLLVLGIALSLIGYDVGLFSWPPFLLSSDAFLLLSLDVIRVTFGVCKDGW